MRCVCVIAIAFLAAVAGGGAAGAGGGKGACSSLTSKEVAAAIGEPVAKTDSGKSATGALFCNWYGNDTHLFRKGISLIVATNSVDARYKSYFPFLSKHTRLRGVGTAAVTDGSSILAKNARAFIYIHPLYTHTTITLAAIKALAMKALARA